MNQDQEDDADLPVEKMRDSPAKLAKLKAELKTDYTDPDFQAGDSILPP